MLKQAIEATITEREATLVELADQIWSYAETNYTEYQSATLLADFLEAEGFDVTRNVANIPTAFSASFGSGKPVIGILGEYDALAGLSQAKASATFNPIEQGGNGHGCGHNLLGTAGIGAVLAVKKQIEDGTFTGTIRYYGCPAEEGGAGKVFMARAGVFEDVQAAITWHPLTTNVVMSNRFLANARVTYKFTGKAAHAGAAPHLGRSALDAVEIMNIATNFLREHVTTDARIHYAITNAGGISPNVVQHEAEVEYVIRAPKGKIVRDLVKRVNNIADGAALMTSTSVEKEILAGTSDVLPNKVLEEVMYESMVEIGPIAYTEEERAFAKAIRATFNEEERKTPVDIIEGIIPYQYNRGITYASSDVADVSWLVPTVQCGTACFAADTALHTWQVTAQGSHSIGHKGMFLAAKVMALTAAKLFEQPATLNAAKEALEEERNGEPYVCPIPDEVTVESKIQSPEALLI